MVVKYRKVLLTLVILLGFSLRFYSAFILPINCDETVDISSTRQISFNLKNPKLPLVDKNPETCSIAVKYIIKAGLDLFGQKFIGARIPFVILNTLTIYLIYNFVSSAAGVEVALLASLLFSVSQFAFGVSRITGLCTVIIFFNIISLTLFYRAIRTSNIKLLLLNGFVIGLAAWFKENLIFLIPIYVIFLATSKEYRNWLKNKYLWISFFIAVVVIAPLVLKSLNPEVPRFSFIIEETAVDFSLVGIGLYLGELILLFLKLFPDLFIKVVGSIDMEYPPVNFAFGVVIITSAVIYLKSRRPYIRLLVVNFLFNVIVFSFLRRDDVLSSFWSMGSLNWGSLGFLPGVLLAANFLYELSGKGKLGKLVPVILVLFMFIRTLNYAITPLSYYFPVEEYFIKNQLSRADCLKEGNIEAGVYLPKQAKDLAKDIYNGVYISSKKYAEYRKKAALKLAEILIQEKKYEEAEKYINSVLALDPDNERVLFLKNNLRKKSISE